MTLAVLYAAVKFWIPLLTALGLVMKVYLRVKGSVSTWANSLLDNHMAHIQTAAELAATCLKEMAESNNAIASTIKTMREDFQHSQAESIRVQNAILTGIEVIKAKQ